MKLYPLEPSSRLATNIEGISKKTRMDVLINHNLQLEIFNALKNNREMVKRVFPQQVQGCGYLMGAHPKIGNR